MSAVNGRLSLHVWVCYPWLRRGVTICVLVLWLAAVNCPLSLIFFCRRSSLVCKVDSHISSQWPWSRLSFPWGPAHFREEGRGGKPLPHCQTGTDSRVFHPVQSQAKEAASALQFANFCQIPAVPATGSPAWLSLPHLGAPLLVLSQDPYKTVPCKFHACFF